MSADTILILGAMAIGIGVFTNLFELIASVMIAWAAAFAGRRKPGDSEE